MSVSKVFAKAWSDPEFKEKLMSDPEAALAEHGLTVQEGKKIKVVENDSDTHHIVLPAEPAGGEVSEDDLSKLAGGSSVDIGSSYVVCIN